MVLTFRGRRHGSDRGQSAGSGGRDGSGRPRQKGREIRSGIE